MASLLGLLITRRVGRPMTVSAQTETKTLLLGDIRRVVRGVIAVSVSIEAVTAILLTARSGWATTIRSPRPPTTGCSTPTVALLRVAAVVAGTLTLLALYRRPAR